MSQLKRLAIRVMPPLVEVGLPRSMLELDGQLGCSPSHTSCLGHAVPESFVFPWLRGAYSAPKMVAVFVTTVFQTRHGTDEQSQSTANQLPIVLEPPGWNWDMPWAGEISYWVLCIAMFNIGLRVYPTQIPTQAEAINSCISLPPPWVS